MKYKHKPKGSLLAALDIGSSKVACFIGRVVDDQGTFEVIGVGHHGAKGIRNGTISDINKAESVVRQAVHAAENMAAHVMKGYPLREIIINVPGVHAHSFAQRATVKISGHEITEKDVIRALSKAQERVMSENHELIHTIPVGYTIDGHDGVRHPIGMHGQDMAVDIHLVTGHMGALKNIAACVERSHLDVSALCSAPYAAGLAALVEDEMDLGCTLIDMGGGVTSFAVFQGGHVIYTDAIPIGGQHVTADIANGLTTSLNDAERLKILYGSAMAGQTDDHELIDVPRLGETISKTPNHVPRSLLVGIIQPRLEEVFEMVRGKLSDSGLGTLIGRRVVLTGGASQLHGMRELSEHVLDKKVRLGHPIRISGLPDAVSGPGFATTAGLLTYASERVHEMPFQIMTDAHNGNIWENIKVWLKENW